MASHVASHSCFLNRKVAAPVPNKTFHIPEDEIPLWEAAQRVARQQRTSLYRVVAEALETDLPRIAAKPTGEARWARIAADGA